MTGWGVGLRADTDSVIVVGGGLAGIQAALTLADAGHAVTLLEARARLGGATFSFRRAGLWLDNGQHVFLRCCSAYRAFLRRLAVSHLTTLQPRLDVPVLAPFSAPARLRGSMLPGAAWLGPALATYSALTAHQRLIAARTALRLKRLDTSQSVLDSQTLGAWLRAQGETSGSIAALWDLVALSTLNLTADDASLALGATTLQLGLLGQRGASDIGMAAVPLSQVHGEPARAALEGGGVRVVLRSAVRAIGTTSSNGHHGVWVRTDTEEHRAKSVILAVPHEVAGHLLSSLLTPEDDLVVGLNALGHSAIVNVHLAYDRRVLEEPLAAGLGSPVQWVFDRTEASGLKHGQLLVVSLSAADALLHTRADQLVSSIAEALGHLLPGAASARVVERAVTRERHATFAPRPGSGILRPMPGALSAHGDVARGVYIAGAWTQTGWPATMEGAVRSGTAAAQAVMDMVEAES